MRNFSWFFCVGVSLFLAAACRAPEPQPEYRPTATIKDIMDSIVDPSADFLWDSVATVVTTTGTEERAPRNDEEWTNVRRRAIQLVEATNLLQIPGRHVARPGEKSANPGIELGPEEIEKVINQDRAAWINFAHGLHDAVVPALKAIETKDAQALSDAGEKIDSACENCHLKYWYPNQEEELKKALKIQQQGNQ